MGFLRNIYGYKPRCVLLVSTGGGGDVATALLYAYIVQSDSTRAVVAALPWERYVKDPCPGPIELETLSGVERLDYVVLLRPGCSAIRCGNVFIPTTCKAVSLDRVRPPLYALDGWGGELSIRRGLEEVSSLHGCEAALVIDVGGDIIARGCEANLWSPLGDSLGLSAIIDTDLDSKVLVQGLGADGELSEDELLSIVADLASRNAVTWCRGITREEADLLREITRHIHTEAGRIPLLALQGYYGKRYIRDGTRSVNIDIFKSCAIVFEPGPLYELSLPAKLVKDTSSLEEARRRLNDAGVYTELDLEIDIHKLIELGVLTPPKVLEVRERGRSSLPRCTNTYNK